MNNVWPLLLLQSLSLLLHLSSSLLVPRLLQLPNKDTGKLSLSQGLSVRISLCLFTYLSVCLSACCLPICLSVLSYIFKKTIYCSSLIVLQWRLYFMFTKQENSMPCFAWTERHIIPKFWGTVGLLENRFQTDKLGRLSDFQILDLKLELSDYRILNFEKKKLSGNKCCHLGLGHHLAISIA